MIGGIAVCRLILKALLCTSGVLLSAATITVTFDYDFTGKPVCVTPADKPCLDHFEILDGTSKQLLLSVPIPGRPTGPMSGIRGVFFQDIAPASIAAIVVGRDQNGSRTISDPLVATMLVTPSKITIDAGSAADQYFTGGLAYTIAGASGDVTLRYGDFSYLVPGLQGLYKVTLFMRETGTVSAKGGRVFQVKINDQPVLDRFDLFNTVKLALTSRSYLSYAADGAIKLDFVTQFRSAVVSSIEIEPFVEIFQHITGLARIDIGGTSIVGLPTLPDWKQRPGWRPVRPGDGFVFRHDPCLVLYAEFPGWTCGGTYPPTLAVVR